VWLPRAAPRAPVMVVPEAADASDSADQAPADERAPERDIPLGRSAAGALFERADPRLGRRVLVERRDLPLGAGELGRLRALAALGGPHVQRVLSLSDDGPAVVIYELIDGPRRPFAEVESSAAFPPRVREALRRAREALRAVEAGAPAGSMREVVLTSGGPVLRVIEVESIVD